MRNRANIIFIFVTVFGLISCESAETKTTNEQTEPKVSEQSEESTANISEEETEDQPKISGFKALVPKGHILYDSIRGDLNGDGREDYVVITKGTDPKIWEKNQFDSIVDRNRRGILVYLSEGDKLNLVSKNLACFSSENEDGGVYFPPELYLEIEKGKLYVRYAHGRYGYWWYTFRYQDGKMKLIGYDNSDNHGPVVQYTYSYNFLTRRKLVKDNINKYSDEPGGIEEVFKETWSDLPKKPLLTLSSIEDFDELSFD